MFCKIPKEKGNALVLGAKSGYHQHPVWPERSCRRLGSGSASRNGLLEPGAGFINGGCLCSSENVIEKVIENIPPHM